MANDPRSIAVESLFLTLADRLPAILVARDLLRLAKRRCKVGPYVLPVGASITVNGTAYPLTSGSRTAAQVAAEAGPLASAEADGTGSRLVFASATAPTREAPSSVRFEGEASTLSVLGLTSGGPSDVAEACVSDPLPALSETEPGEITMIDRPLIFCSDSISGPYRKGSLRQRMHAVKVQLEVWVPGDFALPIRTTLERALELERGIAATLRAGDSRAPFFVGGTAAGAHVVQAKPADLTARTQVFQFRNGGATIPVAIARPVIEMLVSSSDT